MGQFKPYLRLYTSEQYFLHRRISSRQQLAALLRAWRLRREGGLRIVPDPYTKTLTAKRSVAPASDTNVLCMHHRSQMHLHTLSYHCCAWRVLSRVRVCDSRDERCHVTSATYTLHFLSQPSPRQWVVYGQRNPSQLLVVKSSTVNREEVTEVCEYDGGHFS